MEGRIFPVGGPFRSTTVQVTPLFLPPPPCTDGPPSREEWHTATPGLTPKRGKEEFGNGTLFWNPLI